VFRVPSVIIEYQVQLSLILLYFTSYLLPNSLVTTTLFI
jgi:hypothetical protein